MQFKNTKKMELEATFEFDVNKYVSIEHYLIDRSGFWYNQYQKHKKDNIFFDRALWTFELELILSKFNQLEEKEILTALADRMANATLKEGKKPLAPSAQWFSVRYRSFPSLGTYKAFRDDIADLIEKMGSLEAVKKAVIA